LISTVAAREDLLEQHPGMTAAEGVRESFAYSLASAKS
jgi:hypothetical protein